MKILKSADLYWGWITPSTFQAPLKDNNDDDEDGDKADNDDDDEEVEQLRAFHKPAFVATVLQLGL